MNIKVGDVLYVCNAFSPKKLDKKQTGGMFVIGNMYMVDEILSKYNRETTYKLVGLISKEEIFETKTTLEECSNTNVLTTNLVDFEKRFDAFKNNILINFIERKKNFDKERLQRKFKNGSGTERKG